MRRRQFLTYSVAGAALLYLTNTTGAAMAYIGDGASKKDGEKGFPFKLTKQEWKERLSDEEYRVLRKHGTERAHSSPLDKEKRKGVFHCAGCDHPLFSSEHKYNSGTGWPSFYQPLNKGAVGHSIDSSWLMTRTEVHCANCGGHQGHVFEDGPDPTGLRYCINGVALTFKPQE